MEARIRDELRRKRVVVHAGLSKCGSTSLQWQLRQDDTFLKSRSIAVVWEQPGPDDASGVLLGSSLAGDAAQTSLAGFFEHYKRTRRRAETADSREFLGGLGDAVLRNLAVSDVVVVSAEAFETSFSLRDDMFAELLESLQMVAQVQVVIYLPRMAEHVISSWQEWGWYDHIRLLDWVSAFADERGSRDFWSDPDDNYWSDLWDIATWLPWWNARLPGVVDIQLRSALADGDIVRDFYSRVLGVTPHSWCPRQNAGWPMWALPYLPLLAPAFRRDYHRYLRARTLLSAMDASQFSPLVSAAGDVRRLVEEGLAHRVGLVIQRAEHLLGVPSESLLPRPTEADLEAVDHALAEWDAPAPVAALGIALDLLAEELRTDDSPDVQGVKSVGVANIVPRSLLHDHAGESALQVPLTAGLQFRSPLFNMPNGQYDDRWAAYGHVLQQWFETQEGFDQNRRCRYLEIGVWKAGNVVALHEIFGNVFDYVGVDPYGELLDDPYLNQFWSTDEEAEDAFTEAKQRFDQHGATLHRMASDDFFAADVGAFDVVFIDGDHRYAQAKRDLHAGFDHLRPGGLLLCDDVGNNFHPEVEWAVRHFFEERKDEIAAYGGHPLFFQLEGMPLPVVLLIAAFAKQ
jgi:hypothetical protein